MIVTMRGILAVLLMLALLALSARATAQEKPRKNETYCLQTAGGENGGGAPLQCNFETLEQCLASKTANNDTRTLNPAIGLGKRSS